MRTVQEKLRRRVANISVKRPKPINKTISERLELAEAQLTTLQRQLPYYSGAILERAQRDVAAKQSEVDQLRAMAQGQRHVRNRASERSAARWREKQSRG